MTSEYCLSNLSCKDRLLDNSLMSRKFKMCVYSVFQGIYFLLLVLRINILLTSQWIMRKMYDQSA